MTTRTILVCNNCDQEIKDETTKISISTQGFLQQNFKITIGHNAIPMKQLDFCSKACMFLWIKKHKEPFPLPAELTKLQESQDH